MENKTNLVNKFFKPYKKNFIWMTFLNSARWIHDNLVNKEGYINLLWRNIKSHRQKRVLELIPENDRQSTVKNKVFVRDLTEDQVLAVLWNIEDHVFSIKILLNNNPMTRREVLSVFSLVHDLIGFGARFLLKGNFYTYPTMMELYLNLRRSKNYMNCITHTLSSADSNVFDGKSEKLTKS